MRLYECEAKELLKQYDIAIPQSEVLSNPAMPTYTVVKAQVLTGGRGKAGAVKVCNTQDEAAAAIKQLLHSTVLNEKVESVLVEEKINAESEFYVAVTYDTDSRSPVLLLGPGGVDVEQQQPHKFIINQTSVHVQQVETYVATANLPKALAQTIANLINCFFKEDCRLLEINPLTETGIALDAMIDLDDDAFFRHERDYKPRTPGAGTMTDREQKVKHINDADHRGTIKFMELDGDIGFLAAGGGGSITCMDALLQANGKPANYTEYSGNPSTEKVYELTKVILSKPLKALWIVGAIANFTKVDDTMQGIVKALEKTKPRIPIIVRRSGPNEKQGLALLQEAAEKHSLDIEVHGKETPMTQTATIVVEKAYGNSD